MDADRIYVLAAQRSQPRVAQFELVALADGTVDTQWVRDWDVPSMNVNGTPMNLASKQFEGLVVDQQTCMLFAGQEDVGIWRIDLNTGAADASPFVLSRTYDPSSALRPELEDLTIYYGANGAGYRLAFSEGDNSFALFYRQAGNTYGFATSPGPQRNRLNYRSRLAFPRNGRLRRGTGLPVRPRR